MLILAYNADFSADEPHRVIIDYFARLSEVVDKFNRETGYGISELYNKYGQKLPLSYQVQKTGLEVYYHKPKSRIPVSSESESESE